MHRGRGFRSAHDPRLLNMEAGRDGDLLLLRASPVLLPTLELVEGRLERDLGRAVGHAGISSSPARRKWGVGRAEGDYSGSRFVLAPDRLFGYCGVFSKEQTQ